MNENPLDVLQVRLYGGLGNQLFQYFAGTYLSQSLKKPLEVDFNWIDRGQTHAGSDIRDFRFFQQGRHVISPQKSTAEYFAAGLLTSLSRRFDFVATLSKIDITFGDLQDLDHLVSRKVKLRGYYQSPFYFQNLILDSSQHVLDLVSGKFSLVQELNPNYIGIHIRGGDYLEKTNLYNQLHREYYTNAILRLTHMYPGYELQVFTDDKKYAHSLIDPGFDYVFFDDRNMRASQVLQHMASCKALVIANSSFSYWAGLAGNAKTVISPKDWFRCKMPRVTFPQGWICI
jgi:hypothetical protein